ncbi:primosome assembly protein PriA [Listeria floridensis FSL S10-1187]|uniref:Primosome assembly protein PriA n=1 Tax=Listeria floridensis FSL S10-1187 TaxID=1265817 RepID=A0ABP3B0U1_9LIST|nr:primosome assembly protein PriA [Listeria floridensis FSL S10-1187]
MNRIAKVIVDVPARQVDRPFDYLIPTELLDIIQVGTRVSVPFGNRKVQGFVVAIQAEADTDKLKEIDSAMDILPVLNQELLELGDWIASDTLSFRVSVYQAMLPPALRAKYEKYFIRLNDSDEELERLFGGYGTLDFKKAEQVGLLPQFKKYLQDGDIEIGYAVKNKVTQKKNENGAL